METLGISSNNLLIWAFFGLLIGSFVSSLEKRHVAGGNFVTEIFGSLGGVISGYLASFFLGQSVAHFSVSVLLIAAIGSFLLAKFYQISFSDQGYIKTNHSTDDL